MSHCEFLRILLLQRDQSKPRIRRIIEFTNFTIFNSRVSFSTAELHSMLLTNQNRIEDFIVQEFEGCSPGFMERLRVVREAQSWTEDDRIIDRSYQVNEGKARNVKHRDSVVRIFFRVSLRTLTR